MLGITNSEATDSNHAKIYGFAIDRNVSTSPNNIIFTKDAAGMSYDDRCKVYNMFAEPAVASNEDGQLAYKLDPTNVLAKTNGESVTLDGTDGEAVVLLNEMWYRSYLEGSYEHFEFAFFNPENIGISGFNNWIHKTSDTESLPYVMLGMFKASGTSSAGLHSINTEDKPARSMNMNAFETGFAKTGETTDSLYTGTGFGERNLMIKMLQFLAGSTNSQGFYGQGYVVASYAEENLAATNLGFDATNMLKSGNTASGLSGVNSGYLNNYWGNVNEFCHQTIYNLGKLKFSYLHNDHVTITSTTYNTAPATWYETTETLNPLATTAGWTYGKTGMVTDTPACAFPATTGGSTSSYFYDGLYQPAIENATNRCVPTGGSLTGGALAGLSCLGVDGALSSSDWNFGSRLLIRPTTLSR